jgi:hypothetical protein
VMTAADVRSETLEEVVTASSNQLGALDAGSVGPRACSCHDRCGQ